MTDSSKQWAKRAVIPSLPEEGRKVVESILEGLRALGWQEEQLFGVHLAVEEALVNAIKHGNEMDPEKTVEIECVASGERVAIRVTEQGPGFRPEDVPDPTLDENLECPSGRGLMLMRSFMTRVEHNALGNSVLLEKVREASED